jgi:cytochrome c biogenesis protein CcdA
MVGVIGPLVQGKREVRGAVGSVTVFGLGAVAGALITGSLVGLLGGAAQALVGEHVLAVAVGAAGCVLLLADLGFLGLRTPTLRRQTSSAWYRERGARTAWGLWGLDLGLGFSTIRLSSLYWLMVLFVVAFVPPVLAPLVLAFYGLGLGAAFAAAVVAQAQTVSPGASPPGLGLLRAARPVRLASDAFLGLLSITIVLTWGAPWW